MTARILIVEDESIIANSLKYILRSLEYDVIGMIASGEEVVQKVLELSPDLILMDIELKNEVNGIEASKLVNALINPPPIIFITAYADNATVEKAKITAPYGYILKPFDERELGICIETVLFRNKIEKKLRESEQRFITTLKSIGEPVVITDMAGKITFMNFLAESYLQLPNLESNGTVNYWDDWFIIENKDGMQNLRSILRKGIVFEMEKPAILNQKIEQQLKVQNLTISPIIDDQGTTLGGVIVIRPK